MWMRTVIEMVLNELLACSVSRCIPGSMQLSGCGQELLPGKAARWGS